MNKKFLAAATSCLAIAFMLLFSNAVLAQTSSKPVKLKSQRGTNARGGADTNIKNDSMLNDPNAPLMSVTPLAKTGTTARGGMSKVVELKSELMTNARGGAADPNVKNDSLLNDAKGAAKKPMSRGQRVCEVRFDNNTGWIIKVYVDGVLRGAMGGYDAATVRVAAGVTRVFARADFTDGSVRTWGPRDYDCVNEYIDFSMVR